MRTSAALFGTFCAALFLSSGAIVAQGMDEETVVEEVVEAGKDTEESAELQAAKADFAKIDDANAHMNSVREEWGPKFQKVRVALQEANKGDDEEAKKKAKADYDAVYEPYLAAFNAARDGIQAAESNFAASFAKLELEEVDVESNKDFLVSGATISARQASNDHNWDDAVRFNRFLYDKFSDDEKVWNSATENLADALVNKGNFELAKSGIKEMLGGAADTVKPNLMASLGDAYVSNGESIKAAGLYEAAVTMIPAGLGARHPLMRSKRYLEFKANLLGRQAPEIASETWVGEHSANSLGEMRGKIVVIDFWATWCGPCRAAMPGLDDLAKEYKSKGVEVMGVTRYYSSGYMVPSMDALRNRTGEGERVTDISEDDYLEHITQFHNNTAPSYPFVITDVQPFKDYNISGIPSMIVVDKEGRIAYASVGANKVQLKQVLKHLTAAPEKAADEGDKSESKGEASKTNEKKS